MVDQRPAATPACLAWSSLSRPSSTLDGHASRPRCRRTHEADCRPARAIAGIVPAAAGHAIGLRGHVLAQKSGNVAACRVAMEHLEKEPLNRGDRVKLPGSPRVSDRSAQRHDRSRIEGLADIVFDLHHRLLDTGGHRRPLVRECWLQQLHSRPEVFLFSPSRLARPPACNASIDVLASDAVATKGLTAIFVPFVPDTFSSNHIGWCVSGPLAAAEHRVAAAGKPGEGHDAGGRLRHNGRIDGK